MLGPLEQLFPDTPGEAWGPYRERYPELFAGDSWRLPIMCFLVREGGSTVVVDTGAPPMNQMSGEPGVVSAVPDLPKNAIGLPLNAW